MTENEKDALEYIEDIKKFDGITHWLNINRATFMELKIRKMRQLF